MVAGAGVCVLRGFACVGALGARVCGVCCGIFDFTYARTLSMENALAYEFVECAAGTFPACMPCSPSYASMITITMYYTANHTLFYSTVTINIMFMIPFTRHAHQLVFK